MPGRNGVGREGSSPIRRPVGTRAGAPQPCRADHGSREGPPTAPPAGTGLRLRRWILVVRTNALLTRREPAPPPHRPASRWAKVTHASRQRPLERNPPLWDASPRDWQKTSLTGATNDHGEIATQPPDLSPRLPDFSTSRLATKRGRRQPLARSSASSARSVEGSRGLLPVRRALGGFPLGGWVFRVLAVRFAFLAVLELASLDRPLGQPSRSVHAL